jgi:SulP family sulfate permease
MLNSSETQTDFASITSSRLITDILAGLLVGLVALIYSVSYATLIFSGPLIAYLAVGVRLVLISAAVAAFVAALTSSFRIAISGPDSNASVFTALIVGNVTAVLLAANPEQSPLPTVLILLALNTLLAGFVLFTTGRLRLGKWVRYVPFPVVGGFLAASGWLFVKGGFGVVIGQALGPATMLLFLQPTTVQLWLPALLFALLLFFSARRTENFYSATGAICSWCTHLLWLFVAQRHRRSPGNGQRLVFAGHPCRAGIVALATIQHGAGQLAGSDRQ